jgi:hypothetical protein
MAKQQSFKEIINQYVKLLDLKMKTDEMIFLKKYHFDEYETKLSEYVPKFNEEYPFLFKMVINGSDLSILDKFLDNIDDIDNGKKSLNDARNELGMMLHNKFVDKTINK